MNERAFEKTAFLHQSGWSTAQRSHLAGDASARSYERLVMGDRRAVLMDSPPGPADDTADFLRIGAHLAGLGLSPPQVIEAMPERGLLLLEDLGDALFTHVLAENPAVEPQLYDAAIDVLLVLQAAAPPQNLPNFSAQDWAEAAGFAPKFYASAIQGPVDAAEYTAVLAQTLCDHADGARVLLLRDYHAGNLIWLPERKDVARVGLLDFQQAQLGQPGYDLVSLLQDARRDVARATEAQGLSRFAQAKGLTLEEIKAGYAVIGAQRALRIIGIFARLCLVSGKPGYVALIPRVWEQLMRNLAHPELAELRRICLRLLPEPTTENLNRITAQCATRSP
ncbi:phosphotransferase [Xinfangfangia sp. CPCC 101601]|uniref:Phosphotransferase n=1 Tax=Pseudogemmobacter lacusdianii TaxID=3069608 RepID=A0ABU0VTZ9_9RHOB|nr:phosphotransferase [Xinfangfangia sp. CPCC 101601]MDQ2065199.1 phosphotransferase [Xinfangfangia sp. CPCC 101601]